VTTRSAAASCSNAFTVLAFRPFHNDGSSREPLAMHLQARREVFGLTKRRRERTVESACCAGSRFRDPQRPADWIPLARRSFRTADALIVVSSEGYFDVFPPVDRSANDKPTYRGVIAELGSTVRSSDDKLSVRPESAALDAAVATWSRNHGAAAVRGEMGFGRNDSKN